MKYFLLLFIVILLLFPIFIKLQQSQKEFFINYNLNKDDYNSLLNCQKNKNKDNYNSLLNCYKNTTTIQSKTLQPTTGCPKKKCKKCPIDCVGYFTPKICGANCKQTYKITQKEKNGGLQCSYENGYQRDCKPGEGNCKDSSLNTTETCKPTTTTTTTTFTPWQISTNKPVGTLKPTCQDFNLLPVTNDFDS